MPVVAITADAEGGGGYAAPAEVADKLVWTLVRPHGTGIAEFQRQVLEDLAVAAGSLVSGATSVRVTLQEPNASTGGRLG